MEMDILDKMSDIIDDARETDVQADRTALYEEAMGYVLDLAIELPVYQRKQLYAYNANIIDRDSFPEEINPYSSPLDRLWEISFTEGAASGGSSSAGIVVGCIFGAALVGTAAVVTVKYTKKRKQGYVIPETEIDYEDLDAYNAFYKRKRR